MFSEAPTRTQLPSIMLFVFERTLIRYGSIMSLAAARVIGLKASRGTLAPSNSNRSAEMTK